MLRPASAPHPGHVRNIHFPFDIEADTPISVASEMVEELDLTDQDVSTIADMIDSEIRHNFPEWTAVDICGYNSDEDSPISDSYSSEIKEEASPLANQSSPLKTLALERLPSGRKYWSDSPKGLGGNSPVTPGPSHLSSPASLESTRGSLVEKDEEKETAESASNEDDVEIIAEKLESLLLKQQMELDELKKKHESGILDFLNGLSSVTRQKVLDICKVKIPNYK